MLETALERTGLRPHLPHVLSVDPLGIYKPAPRVYEEAPHRLGVASGRILFVSGNAWDAAGAASFGLRVAWLNRAGVPFDMLGQQPDWEIHSLYELADGLGGPSDARGGA
jgi:2-haloacid dehalogenase